MTPQKFSRVTQEFSIMRTIFASACFVAQVHIVHGRISVGLLPGQHGRSVTRMNHLAAASSSSSSSADTGNDDSSPIPCCPPFGPAPPAPFNGTYEEKWMTQPNNHFNYLQPTNPVDNSTATFQQRYLYSDAHWGGAGFPIVFVPCVEAGPATYYWGEYGWVVDHLAKNLSALVVFGEHRGFGLTMAGGTTTPESWYPDSTHLGLLTEAQVMEDDVALITSLRTNLSAWDSPVISAGGSLAGEMSTWLRVRYPFMIDMALAGSAPIFGFFGLTDPFGWNRVVTEAFQSVGGDECVNNIRNGYLEVSSLSPAEVTSAFQTCTPATLPCHPQQLADLMMDWAGGAAESSYPQNMNSSLVLVTCESMKGSTSGLEAYQRAYAPAVPGQCLNISWDWQCSNDENGGRRVGGGSKKKKIGDDSGYCLQHYMDPDCQDGWSFESCTTEIHPIWANNVTE